MNLLNGLGRSPSGPLVLASAIAGGTLAYADPVRFENDGSFHWTDDVFLDVTKPVRKQTGLDSGVGSFEFEVSRDSYYLLYPKSVVGSTPDAMIHGYPVTTVRNPGAIVPIDFGRDDWYQSVQLGYYYQAGSFYTQFDKAPLGIPGDVGYIGARFDIDGLTHYGWIGLTLEFYRTGIPRPHWRFDLIAWGYETEPGRRIAAGAVPAPGAALALLAFGAAAGATRHRNTASR